MRNVNEEMRVVENFPILSYQQRTLRSDLANKLHLFEKLIDSIDNLTKRGQAVALSFSVTNALPAPNLLSNFFLELDNKIRAPW
jgi:uracil DNA glycosylase